MKIRLNKDSVNQREAITSRLKEWTEQSRFTADITLVDNTIEIYRVRLREAKGYCGNHPSQCPSDLGLRPERPHKHYKFLEGMDWVDFDDCVNDVLDSFEADARFTSANCLHRRGKERRIVYEDYTFNGIEREWVRTGKPSHYQNYCGKTAPASEYPEGTPGLYTRTETLTLELV